MLLKARNNVNLAFHLVLRGGMHARPAYAIVKVVKSLKDAGIETTIMNTEFNVSVNGLNVLDLMFIGVNDDKKPLKFILKGSDFSKLIEAEKILKDTCQDSMTLDGHSNIDKYVERAKSLSGGRGK